MSMGDERFWARVHAILDERGDPLDDPEVLAQVGERPDLLEELAAVLGTLRRIPAIARPDRVHAAGRRRARALAAVAGVLLLVAAGALVSRLAGERPKTSGTPQVEAAVAPAAPAGRVLAYRIEVSIESPGRRLAWVSESSGRTITVSEESAPAVVTEGLACVGPIRTRVETLSGRMR